MQQFKVPFMLSPEERTLMDLYRVMNEMLTGPEKTWRLIKEESSGHSSVRASGYIEVSDHGVIRTSDKFTASAEGSKGRNVLYSMATIKLIVLCSNSLGLPIDFAFSRLRKDDSKPEEETWKETATACGMDIVEVSKISSIKALVRYARQHSFPIYQALDEAKETYKSERVSAKQFFEFVYGEAQYSKIKSITKKRPAKRVEPVVTQPVAEEKEVIKTVEAPKDYTPIIPESIGRSAADTKYVIGKLIAQGINTKTFPQLHPKLAEKYGNLQYFCINSTDDELSSVIIDSEL